MAICSRAEMATRVDWTTAENTGLSPSRYNLRRSPRKLGYLKRRKTYPKDRWRCVLIILN